MDKQKLRCGVIGLGKMGLLHASLLNVLPDVEVVAVCDKSTLLKRLYKKIFSPTGIQMVDDLEKLSGLELDAVHVTTPINSHSAIIKNLLTQKITRNVFVEKTLASNYTQAKELVEIVKEAGGISMVGYMKRFSVVFGKAKELLTQGDLGEPTSFSAYAYSSDFLGLTKESKSSAKRGGALRDSGCHIIDLALWLLGELEVQDVVSIVKDKAGSETAVSFTATNPVGLNGQINVSQRMPDYRMPEFGLTIETSKAKINVNDDRLCLTLKKNNNQRKWYRHDLNDNVFFSIGDAEYFRENNHFVTSLLENREAEPSFNTASRVDYVIEQVKNRSD